MSDPQQRQPSVANFEVPDLELEPPPRSLAKITPALTKAAAQSHEYSPSGVPKRRGYGTPNSFEPDSSAGQGSSLELDQGPRDTVPPFGGFVSFEDPEAFELEPIGTAQSLASSDATRVAETERVNDRKGAGAAWPTGRAADPTQLKIDPIQLAILADYGDSPRAAQLTPAYAYRVFTRQRALKRQLLTISAECERAQVERESTLADLSCAVRLEAERVESLRLFFSPLLKLEQARSQHKQAWFSAKQQALGSQYQGQLETRSLIMTKHEADERRALAELGRAVLAAGGAVEVPSAWLARVRSVSERADQLIARRELQRSAIAAYDRVRVTQGVRLACTAIGLLIVLIGLKLAF
jgi:hypothetical protein